MPEWNFKSNVFIYNLKILELENKNVLFHVVY